MSEAFNNYLTAASETISTRLTDETEMCGQPLHLHHTSICSNQQQ